MTSNLPLLYCTLVHYAIILCHILYKQTMAKVIIRVRNAWFCTRKTTMTFVMA